MRREAAPYVSTLLTGAIFGPLSVAGGYADKKQCWVSKDYNCPLKEQCNGLVKPECKEHIGNEEACHAIDKMIEWYYQVEEPEFLKFYNCHLEMLERHGDN